MAFNPLAALFGNQAAAALDPEDELGPELAPGQEGNPIDVSGSRGAPPSPAVPTPGQPQPSATEIDQYLTMGLDNTEAIRQRDAALKAGEAQSNRKGAFGVGGTLRDVLGILSDGFLVQSGNKAVYAPMREKEKYADAMAGSTVNPMAAIERAMGVNPEAAMDFQKNYVTGQNASTRNTIDQGEADRKLFNDAMGMSSQMMAAAVASGDPVQIERAKEGIATISARTKIPVEQLMAGGSPENVAGRGATSYQNLRLPQQERSLDQGDERIRVAWANAKTNQERAAIMREALGEKMDQNSFENMLDLFDISVDSMKDKGSSSSTSRASTVSAPPMNPAEYKGRTLSGPGGTWTSDGKKWTRKN